MRTLSLALLLVVSIFCRTSWADAREDEAQARFQAGLSFAAQGKWDYARLAFLQAYTVIPSVDILWNLAYVELKSGNALDALAHFKTYERDPRAEPAKIAALPKLRERAYQQIGRVKVRAPVTALISIDGNQSTWAEPIDVQPGEHKIAAKVGERAQEQSFSILAGQVIEVPFSFPDEPRAASMVRPSPTPSSTAPAAPETPKTESKARYWVSGGLGVAAIAAAGVGLGYFAMADSEKESIDRNRMLGMSCEPSNADCVQSQRSHVDLSHGFLIGSAGLAAAAVVTFFVWPRSSSSTGLVVLPHAHGADLNFSTRF